MAEISPAAEKMLDGEDSFATPWPEMRRRLVEGGTHWLSTVRPDGRPHVVPVGGAWVDGAMFFTTGQGTRKERNLVTDGRCVVTVSRDDFDIVIEGEAAKVHDEATLERAAEVYRSSNGWPVTVRDGAFDAPYSAPTTGPPPYDVFAVTPTVMFAFGTAEGTVNGATRYRF